MSASIFISYASADLKVANTLCKALESRGFKCWISSRDVEPGDNFQVSIVRAIRGAKMMLLVFTGNSNNSEEMTKELVLASQHRLIVVPLRIEDVTPNEAFAYEFATRQWIDFFADWEAAMDQLSLRIGSAIGADPAMLAAAAPAAEAARPPEPVAAAPAAAEAPRAPEPAPVVAAPVRVEPKPAPTPEPVKAEVARVEPPRPEPAKVEPAAPSVAAAATATGVQAKAPPPAAKAPAQPVPPKPGAATAPVAKAPPPKTSSAATTETKRSSPVPLVVGAVVVLGVLAAGAAVMLPGMLAHKAAPPPPKPAAIVLKPAAPAPGPTPAANAAASLAPSAAAPTAPGPEPASNALASAATNALAPVHAAHKHPKAAAHAASASEVPF